MIRVFIASPYAGEVQRNVAYARRAVADSLDRGEAPLAPHLMLPQVLDDSVRSDRRRGIAAGCAWLAVADVAAFYVDNGWSSGMRAERAAAEMAGIQVDVRSIAK